MAPIKNIVDIVDWRLCLGCGACAYICPQHKIQLVDILEQGIRPTVPGNDCGTCTQCLEVCPGYENDHTTINTRPGLLAGSLAAFGPVLEIWEGHAADPEIRFRGSSGGALTAIALHCLENENMHGVLHIGSDAADPLRNKTILSRNRADLLARTGSRYAPASVCDRLDLVEHAPQPCVVIGQPSEVTALRKAQGLKPALDAKVGLALSFFCAGSPAREGTIELIKRSGIDPVAVESLRYRGNGWPGMFSVRVAGQSAPVMEMTYRDSWSFVQAYRPYATHMFPDGTGEDADISCGDPWHRPIPKDEPGLSMMVVRTERGREILRRAVAAGHIVAWPATEDQLARSQANLTGKRGAIWGRLLAFRLLRIPHTRYRGYAMFPLWLRLSFREKCKSVLGTMRRALQRGFKHRAPPIPRSPS